MPSYDTATESEGPFDTSVFVLPPKGPAADTRDCRQPLPSAYLQALQLYQFEPLIERLLEKECWHEDTARAVFADLKRFLVLSDQVRPSARTLLPPPTIDTAWHHFLLFSREYEWFCGRWLRGFIHHEPFTRQQRRHRVESGQHRMEMHQTREQARRLFGPLSPYWGEVAPSNLVMKPATMATPIYENDACGSYS